MAIKAFLAGTQKNMCFEYDSDKEARRRYDSVRNFRKCQISVHQKTRCQESPWQRGKNNYGLQETGAFQGSRDRTTSG